MYLDGLGGFCYGNLQHFFRSGWTPQEPPCLRCDPSHDARRIQRILALARGFQGLHGQAFPLCPWAISWLVTASGGNRFLILWLKGAPKWTLAMNPKLRSYKQRWLSNIFRSGQLEMSACAGERASARHTIWPCTTASSLRGICFTLAISKSRRERGVQGHLLRHVSVLLSFFFL